MTEEVLVRDHVSPPATINRSHPEYSVLPFVDGNTVLLITIETTTVEYPFLKQTPEEKQSLGISRNKQ